jgi:hypothetical protein
MSFLPQCAAMKVSQRFPIVRFVCFTVRVRWLLASLQNLLSAVQAMPLLHDWVLRLPTFAALQWYVYNTIVLLFSVTLC